MQPKFITPEDSCIEKSRLADYFNELLDIKVHEILKYIWKDAIIDLSEDHAGELEIHLEGYVPESNDVYDPYETIYLSLPKIVESLRAMDIPKETKEMHAKVFEYLAKLLRESEYPGDYHARQHKPKQLTSS